MFTEENILYVKKARNGKGVFVKKDINPNAFLLEITGKFLTCDVDEDIDDETRNNTFRYDEDLYISPGKTVGNFINHSCVPNVKIVKKNKKLFVVSILPINKGGEILFDYSTVIARDDIWEMKCDCGYKVCRGIIKQFNKLPKKIKEKYIKEGIVPKFILEI